MKTSSQEFVEDLTRQSVALQKVLQEVLDYWQPDEPPMTVLFGELGKAVADEYENESDKIKKKWFRLIEDAMKSDDDELITVVATGLLEALVGRATKNGVWECIFTDLGEHSRRYADSWLRS